MASGKVLIAAGAAVALALAARSSSARLRPTAAKPGARDMTTIQALAELYDAQSKGEIQFRLGTLPGRVTLESNVAGVEYVYIDTPRRITEVDPRFAVFLLRLAKFLRDRFGVTTIRHYGIYPGGDASSDDVHNHGRAIDLFGVQGDRGLDLIVERDWGRKHAPYPADTTSETIYRLKPGEKGYDVLQAIYSFATKEASDRSTRPGDNTPPTRIGQGSYIITPDHPTPARRKDHNNHFHIQIGPTVGTDSFGT